MDMDIEKIRQWMEITNEYRKTDFWSSVLKQQPPKDFFSTTTNEPKYDVYRNEQTVCVVIELPGIQLNQLSLDLISKERVLIKTKVIPPISNELALRQERNYGDKSLEIDLPEPTEAQLLSVQYQDGLLYIYYPRKIENIKFND